ncbi:MAG: F0F1 ATP synthase subunit epsilon [Candidatus Doudnabacteria bacterium]|nr:F0F1 ATP synthase subunit epsilon [Candidatus Doudnabacteria bacterium]
MLKLKIVTPERVLLDEQVDQVTLPTQLGEITVLPNHIPLIANLVSGEVRYKTSGKENFFVVSSGMIEVKKKNEIVVLAETAEFGQEIDVERAEKARERAKKLMQESYRDERAFADAAAGLERHLARLKVARKHRTRTHRNLESGTLKE